jgi:hypothetical protein
MTRATTTRRVFVLAAALTLLTPAVSDARSGGITTLEFNDTVGCNFCHGGGNVPIVQLTGPTVVSLGSTNQYTLTVFETGLQNHAGLNVESADGVLDIPIGALDVQTLIGTGGRDEITHTMPKAMTGGAAQFTFEWTAPAGVFVSAELDGWGNAVDDNSGTNGDRGALAELTIYSDLFDTPTPTPAPPTPTPTPAGGCADLVPRNPDLIVDSDLRSCQETIAKAGLFYAKKKMRAVQKCLNDFQKGKLQGDPVLLCRGTFSGSYTPPTDSKTAQKIDKAKTKLESLIETKCDDDLLLNLDTCATTVNGVKGCLTTDTWATVDGLIDLQYGNVVETADNDTLKCQKTIGSEALKFFIKSLKAIEKCLNSRNKEGIPADAATACIGSVSGGVYTPPTDQKAFDTITAAETKLRDKVDQRCSATELGNLDSCGSEPTVQADCTVCAHREAFISIVDTAYGGN